jgi:DNA-binding SARP family transcriptional activator
MQTLWVQLLGNFALTYRDKLFKSLTAPRLQTLLAYLVLHAGTPQPRRQIAFLFWPDSDESQSRTNLRKLIYDLRQTWEQVDEVLDLDGPELSWREDVDLHSDVEAFTRLASQSDSIPDLKNALELYQGDLLPNCYDDWVLAERQQLQQLYLQALDNLVERLEGERDYTTAIRYAQRYLQHAPLQEETYRRLMRLYALNDDRAGVVRTYHACATALQRELQVEPSQPTQEIYNRLLNLSKPASLLPPVTPKLTGRSAEWAQLQSAWGKAQEGHPYWVVLSGDEGVGKTRLAEELVNWAAKQGLPVASAKCYPLDQDAAYNPVAALLRARPLPGLNKIWLGEIARLLPEILVDHPQVAPPEPIEQPWQQQRFHEALARAILSAQPLLMFIDNLHWIDPHSLEWLGYLTQYDPQARLLIVATLRKAKLESNPPLAALLPALERAGQLTEVQLEPLSQSETGELAAQVFQESLDPQRTADLYQNTGGNPFYALESLRAVQAGPAGDPAAPPGTRLLDPLANRLQELSPRARQLSALAATLGRAMSTGMLKQLDPDVSEAFIESLNELWQGQVLREHASDAYTFSHETLGDLAYSNLSESQRRGLHRKVAQALESSLEGDLDLVSGEIAFHYEQAGDLERAAEFYIRAGDAAMQVYAHQAAINDYQRALALPPAQENTALMLKLGRLWERGGDHELAEAIYRQAVHVSESLGDQTAKALALLSLGELPQKSGALDQAAETLEAALAAFESSGDRQGLARVLAIQGRIAFRRLDIPTALGCFQRQREIAGEIDDPALLAAANGGLGQIQLQQGDLRAALVSFQTQLDLTRESGDPAARLSALSNLGGAYLARGEIPLALDTFNQELQAALGSGDRLGQARALTDLGDTYLKGGDLAKAFDHYLHAADRALGDQPLLVRALGGLGRIYRERGESELALRCLGRSLQLALPLRDLHALLDRLGDIAGVYAQKEQYPRADQLLERVIDGYSAASLALPLCRALIQSIRLQIRLGHYAQAMGQNRRLVALARGIQDPALRFEARRLDILLAAERQGAGSEDALEQLESLLDPGLPAEQQAALQASLARLAPQRDSYPRTAAELYRDLYLQTFKLEYKRAYQALTGQSLPPAPPLPRLPERLLPETLDLESLVAEALQQLKSVSSVQSVYK